MQIKKVAVIGHFAFGLEYLDGQTVKTKILTQALCDHFGENEVLKADTHGWSQNPLKFMRKVWKTVSKAENIVILPAHNGLRVNAPLLAFQKLFFRSRKLHYVVIGGWLPVFLQKRKE